MNRREFNKLAVSVGACASLGPVTWVAGEASPVEPTYRVSLNQAHKGTLEIDTRLLDSYGRLPENRRSFYLKAREILTASPGARLTDPKIIALAEQCELPLIGGPMLGNLGSNNITIWLRPGSSEALTVKVEGGKKQLSFPVSDIKPGAAARVELEGLSANTEYTYHVVDKKDKTLANGTFTTAPEPEDERKLRISFGSCFHKIGVHNPNLMGLIAKRGNRAMLLLGDAAVDDREDRINLHTADYLLRDSSTAWRKLSANIPIYASWDDHDYLNNDKSGIPRNSKEKGRKELRRTWQENWINPAVDAEELGIYFTASIGAVDIIMLDTRSCRDMKIRGKRGSYLGEEQMTWLKKTLKASKANFILLSSGTMWSDCISNGKDSWGTWDEEGREEIFDFIEKEKIGGVLLLSGDRHGARGFRIQRPGGFTLYEFEAATLGGVPGPPAYAKDKSQQIFGYKGMIAFGEFAFDMSNPDPEVTFRLINEAGEELEKHVLHRSRLIPGRFD